MDNSVSQSSWHQRILSSGLEEILPKVLAKMVLDYVCYDCQYTIAPPETYIPGSHNRMTWESPLSSGACLIKGSKTTLKPLCGAVSIRPQEYSSYKELRSITILQISQDFIAKKPMEDGRVLYSGMGWNSALHISFTSSEMLDLFKEQQKFLLEEAQSFGLS